MGDPAGISTRVDHEFVRNPSHRGKLELKALLLSRAEHAIIILTKVY